MFFALLLIVEHVVHFVIDHVVAEFLTFWTAELGTDATGQGLGTAATLALQTTEMAGSGTTLTWLD